MIPRRDTEQRSSRLRVVGLSRSKVLLWAVLPTLVAAAVGLLLDWNIDRNVGVSGAVFAAATFIASQFQSQGPPTRSVVMIPKSRSPFSATVHRGLADALASEAAIVFSIEWPKGEVASEVEWQIGMLRSEVCRGSDCLVIVPAADSEELWTELVSLTRAGVFVVVVDTKPTNAFFALRRTSRPFFVGSDFSMGGDLVGQTVAQLLHDLPDSVAVVAGGPSNSWPGIERSRGVAHSLMIENLGQRTKCVLLPNWDRVNGARMVTEAILDASARTPGRVVAFCGNDKILESTERRLLREVDRDVRDRIGLIGYDGATNATGDLIALDGCMALATVDTRPVEQGRVAAEIILEEHRGLLTGRGSRYIAPVVVETELAHEWRSSGVAN